MTSPSSSHSSVIDDASAADSTPPRRISVADGAFKIWFPDGSFRTIANTRSRSGSDIGDAVTPIPESSTSQESAAMTVRGARDRLLSKIHPPDGFSLVLFLSDEFGKGRFLLDMEAMRVPDEHSYIVAKHMPDSLSRVYDGIGDGEGWLLRRKPDRKNWRKYYFKLIRKKNILVFMHNPGTDLKVHFVLHLGGCSVSTDSENDARFSIKSANGEQWGFEAKSIAHRDDWVWLLFRQIAHDKSRDLKGSRNNRRGSINTTMITPQMRASLNSVEGRVNNSRAGVMWKMGNNHKAWRKRSFSLRKDMLMYFPINGDSSHPKGVIPLDQAVVRACLTDFGDNKYGFYISTLEREYLLATERQEDRDGWMADIIEILEAQGSNMSTADKTAVLQVMRKIVLDPRGPESQAAHSCVDSFTQLRQKFESGELDDADVLVLLKNSVSNLRDSILQGRGQVLKVAIQEMHIQISHTNLGMFLMRILMSEIFPPIQCQIVEVVQAGLQKRTGRAFIELLDFARQQKVHFALLLNLPSLLTERLSRSVALLCDGLHLNLLPFEMSDRLLDVIQSVHDEVERYSTQPGVTPFVVTGDEMINIFVHLLINGSQTHDYQAISEILFNLSDPLDWNGQRGYAMTVLSNAISFIRRTSLEILLDQVDVDSSEAVRVAEDGEED